MSPATIQGIYNPDRMALLPGTRLGPYEILAATGSGGMGEVYHARDTRLDRSVAIKVLPEPVLQDPGRRQRLEREARAISSLSHPNICALYDVGHQDGVDYLVMEYLEGETLAERLGKGPLPSDQVMRAALQIAGALDAAHRRGIVHRDLKPGNIMLTPTGAKLLDFGLAKAATPAGMAGGLSAEHTQATPLTAEGTVVGTVPYMSPEQVEGKEVDARSDIFSLGSVLYEMVTGRRPFDGKSPISLASAILEKEPAPIRSLKPMTPHALDHAIQVCLAKDPNDRWQSARDLWLELKWATDPRENTAASATSHRKWREWIAWAVGALGITLGVVIAAFQLSGSGASGPRPTMRFSVQLPMGQVIDRHAGGHLAMSPDGTRIIVLETDPATADFERTMVMRSLDQSEFVPVPFRGGGHPFFSPDGQWFGAFDQNKLTKFPFQGGSPVALCDAPGLTRGASWGDDGQIIASFNEGTTGLVRISSGGGKPTPLTQLDKEKGETAHAWPQVLPGSRSVLFTVYGAGGFFDAEIEILSLENGKRTSIFRGGDFGRYFPSGHLIYLQHDTLHAAPFDLERLMLTGEPRPVLEGVNANFFGGGDFAFSRTGDAVYVSSQGPSFGYQIHWLDGSGETRPLHVATDDYEAPQFSPDGKRIAFGITSGPLHGDIWIKDLERDTVSRLTRLPGRNTVPLWTPDGQSIVFISHGHAAQGIYWTRADGASKPQPLMETKGEFQTPNSISPDGKRLAYAMVMGDFSRSEIWTVPIEGDRDHPRLGQPEAFLRTPAFLDSPMFSPDGRWLAYNSDESGAGEVYVRPFPGPGGQYQISAAGGSRPLWSHDGRQLFFLDDQSRINVADCSVTGTSFAAGKPRLWADRSLAFMGSNYSYALSADGKRFAIVLKAAKTEQPPRNTTDRVGVLLNFSEELTRRVPPVKR
ncbi:MAG: protein kinase domain-containing protein [Candidatus Polarisedimenticolia bacterium]